MNTTLITENQALIARILEVLPECAVDKTLIPAHDTVILTDPFGAKSLLKQTSSYVLVLSDTPSFTEGTHLLSLGIRGYLNTYTHRDNLLQAIHSIETGNIWIYPEFIQEMIKQTSSTLTDHSDILTKLTDREEETALLVAKGLSNKEIAVRLDITERTVKNHLTHIFEKLEVNDRFSLALLLK